MTTLAATRPRVDSLKTPFMLALALHIGILAFLVIGNFVTSRENNWGGPGGSVSVGVVGSLPAIPLPTPDVQTPSRVVDNSKGLYQTEPKPKAAPPPDATELPKFQKTKPPKYETHAPNIDTTPPPEPKYNTRPSKTIDNPTPPPPNAVPYGGGGAPAVPRGTASFTMGNTGGTQAGLAFDGANGGDFGARFSWYVTAVQQRVSSNWLQSSIDANLGWAPRVVITFDILRDGTIANIQVTQSSNNYSVDVSARRAVEQSNKVMPLPAAYSGSRVGVEFYFDYKRQ
jgi:periplasmic protein TonB